MNDERFERDLERWESGEASELSLEFDHPEQDVRGLVELQQRLRGLSSEPAPDPEPGWAALRERLPARPRRSAWTPSRLRLVAAVAAALLAAASIAYAAGLGPVRRAIDGILRNDEPRQPVPAQTVQPTESPEDEDRSGPNGGSRDEDDTGDDDRSGRREEDEEDEEEEEDDRGGDTEGGEEEEPDTDGGGEESGGEEEEESSSSGSGGDGSSGSGSGDDEPDTDD